MVGIKYSHLINKSFLFSGKDLKLDNNFIVKHPTVQEILDINEGMDSSNIYWAMVATLTCDPYENMVMLDDVGLDYETADCFDVFLHKWKKCEQEYENQRELYDQIGFKPVERIKQSLLFFVGEHNFEIRPIQFSEDKQDFAIIDIDQIQGNVCDYVITRDMFNLMSQFLLQMNDIDISGRIKPATKTAKRILIEDMRDEINRKIRNSQKDNKDNEDSSLDDYIGNIAMSLAFGGNGSVSVFDANKLKIYQLIAGFKKVIKKENASVIKTGIYSGTIDAKALSDKELDWVN